MLDLITIGDATLDTFLIIHDDDSQCRLNKKTKELCINFADKVCINGLGQSVGGNATNLAVGCARLGLSTSIVSTVGDDMNGLAIKHELEDKGVDTQFFTLQKNKETRFSVVLNFHSERTILSYHGERKYTIPKLPKAQWIYYTSHGEGFEKVQEKILRYLKKNPQTRVALNPGSHQMKYGIPHMRAFIAHTDLLFVNLEEARALLGKKGNAKSCLRGLYSLGAKTVVITDSHRGAFAYDGNELLHMPAYPIEPIAKTGAGDAFASGFLSAQHYGKSLETSLEWGSANAAGVIQKVGAHEGLQKKAGITKLMKKYPKVVPQKV